MKIKIDIDCTPKEARAFFGLPDLAPMQDEVVDALRKRMMDAIELTDPEVLFRTWFSATTRGVDELRRFFSQGGKSRE